MAQKKEKCERGKEGRGIKRRGQDREGRECLKYERRAGTDKAFRVFTLPTLTTGQMYAVILTIYMKVQKYISW